MMFIVLLHFLLFQVFMVLPKTSSCTKSAQVDEQADIRSFKEFLRRHNVAYSAIDWPAEFPESGRGVVALRMINEEEAILHVPVSACIYRQRYEDSELSPLLKPLDNFHALIWVLLFERAKGKASQFWEYINILPKAFSTGDTWTEAELQETQDFRFIRDSRSRKQQLHNSYNEGMDVLFKNKIAIPEAVTFQNYAWAARAVRTRCFQINDTHDHVMVPMADLLNHKETAPTHWHEVNGTFVMWAGPYLPGQEVFGNYRGDFTNYHMGLDYGFVIESNRLNSERIVLPYATKDRDAKMELHLEGDDALALHFAIDPWQTLQFHRMILAPKARDPTIFRPTSVKAEIEVAKYCATHMLALVTGMPTTIGEDYVQYWTNSTAFRNKRTAVALRMGRKKVYLRQASFCALARERVIQCTSSFGLKKPRYFRRLIELVDQFFFND